MAQPKPSKSARKRDHLALQELGERLIGLSTDELSQMPIDDELREAVLAASAMKAHGALRRQKQLIGKLMRHVDAAPIHQALEARSTDEKLAKRIFTETERWRDRIVREGRGGVDAFVEATERNDDALFELLADLQSTASEKTAKTLRRRIFQNIHDTLLARTRNDRIPR